MFKIMNESLGIKETIILGVKNKYFNYFRFQFKYADSSGKITFLGSALDIHLNF